MRSHRLSAACSRWKFNCTCTHIPSNRRLQTHSGSSSVFDIETSTIGLYSFDLLDFHCIFRIWTRFYRCNRANIIRFPSVLFVALTSNLSYSQPSTHVSWFHSNSPPRSGILILLLHFLSITQAFFICRRSFSLVIFPCKSPPCSKVPKNTFFVLTALFIHAMLHICLKRFSIFANLNI